MDPEQAAAVRQLWAKRSTIHPNADQRGDKCGGKNEVTPVIPTGAAAGIMDVPEQWLVRCREKKLQGELRALEC
jgi:hypothetical protein